jgi:hypothetical protein
MNSRDKGKRGEREFAALLRAHGFLARRGQQFSGSPESPDVVCEALAWLHVEVKRVQNLNLTDACVQAEGDQTRSGLNAAGAAKPKKLAWIVAHRRNHAPWLITMRAEFFFELLRDFEPRKNAKSAEVEAPRADRTEGTDSTPHPSPLPDQGGEGDGAHGVTRPT